MRRWGDEEQGRSGAVWVGLLMVAMLLVMLLRLPALAAARHYTELKFQPPELQVPSYRRFVLDNGWLCI